MNFNLQPHLEGKQLVIKPLNPSDFDALYQAASDPLIWEQHQNKDRYTMDEFTLFFKESMASGGALSIADKKTGQLIGSSRFKLIDSAEEVIEIGWTFLTRKYWGGIYNREIKKLMINHILDSAQKVVFYVDHENFRSQAALEKLGAIKMSYSHIPWVLDENAGLTYLITNKIPNSN